MDQPPDDSKFIPYQSNAAQQRPRASLWSTPISFSPHIIFWITLRLYQRVFHYRAPLLEVLMYFSAISAIIFSIIALMFFSKKRKTIDVVSAMTLHLIWLILVFVYIRLFHRR